MKWTGGSKEQLKKKSSSKSSSRGGATRLKPSSYRGTTTNDIFFGVPASSSPQKANQNPKDKNVEADGMAETIKTAEPDLSASKNLDTTMTLARLLDSNCKRKKLTESHLVALSQWSEAAGLSSKPAIPLPAAGRGTYSTLSAKTSLFPGLDSNRDLSRSDFEGFKTIDEGPADSSLVPNATLFPMPKPTRFDQFVDRKMFATATNSTPPSLSPPSLTDPLKLRSKAGQANGTQLNRVEPLVTELQTVRQPLALQRMEVAEAPEGQPTLRVRFSPGKNQPFFDCLKPMKKTKETASENQHEQSDSNGILFWNEGKLLERPDLE